LMDPWLSTNLPVARQSPNTRDLAFRRVWPTRTARWLAACAPAMSMVPGSGPMTYIEKADPNVILVSFGKPGEQLKRPFLKCSTVLALGPDLMKQWELSGGKAEGVARVG
jgi:hypothetical protein